MSTASDKLWRCDWTFVILSAFAFFLSGVTATFAMCNARSHAPELVALARLAQPILQQAPITSAQTAPRATKQLETTTQSTVTPAVIRLASSRAAPVQKPKGTYSTYRVKKGQTLSQLDPEGWQHTCEINKQLGRIKTRDCGLTTEADILLPANIVAALSLEEQQANTVIPPETIKAAELKAPLNLDERLRLAEVARQQFCDHPGNEMSPACAPERAAQAQFQTLALTVGKQSG